MRIDILSLFPEMFGGVFGCSITKRAIEKNILDIQITNPREFALISIIKLMIQLMVVVLAW